MNVWGTNTKRKGTRIPHLEGKGVVDLDIPHLRLLEGTYDLTIALSDTAEVNAFDHWEKRVRFDVHQVGTFDEGVAALDGSWSIS
jgi:hypothetical protein